ncbi:LPS export ABC transporter ATP-binding protein [bacterium CPR1]|nr:LPS export ABC transporter ATP-binding protein [bacterium CPR1]
MNIRLEQLVKAYRRRRVVDGVSLTVEKGEVVGLLGSNGAGKTTTFSMVVGLVKPTAGQIFLGSREVTGLPMATRARLGIGYLAQEPSIFRHLSVEENLRLIWEVRGVAARLQAEKLEALLGEFSLKRVRKSIAYVLSGGERRRVEIARSLAMDPDFLLLDEPFTGVDPIAVNEIQEIIVRLRERGIGILITDHNVRETLAITDRAYIIRDGRILVAGNAREIGNSELARQFYLGENFRMPDESEVSMVAVGTARESRQRPGTNGGPNGH